jgi:hypothetical protein
MSFGSILVLSKHFYVNFLTIRDWSGIGYVSPRNIFPKTRFPRNNISPNLISPSRVSPSHVSPNLISPSYVFSNLISPNLILSHVFPNLMNFKYNFWFRYVSPYHHFRSIFEQLRFWSNF